MIELDKGNSEIMKGFSTVGNNNSLPMENKQYGWICPVCGKGLAPWVSECPCNSYSNTLDTMTSLKPLPGYSEEDYRKNQIIHNVDVNSDEFRGAFSGRYA